MFGVQQDDTALGGLLGAVAERQADRCERQRDGYSKQDRLEPLARWSCQDVEPGVNNQQDGGGGGGWTGTGTGAARSTPVPASATSGMTLKPAHAVS